MHRCDACEYACEDAYMLNFCDECKWYDECPLMTHYCKADHRIECNNGFEPIPEFDDDDEDGGY